MPHPSAYLREELDRFHQELFEFLRIPSVSARSEHNADMRRAADWIAGQFREAGLDSEIVETPWHPIVLGEWRGAGEDAPTLLIYGHYDVQPPEPLEEWESPPFEPEIREGRLYARGSTDDKGQLFLHIKAIEAYLRGGGTLPVNVVILAEGEEEVGSPSLVPFVREHRDRLACDAVVISDSNMFAPGLPSLLFSLRGIAYFEILVRGPAGDLHSGSYGGAVANPALALSRILATLHDERGRVAVPGFYDDVVEWDEETRDSIARLPFSEAGFLSQVGSPSLSGEAGYATLERLWLRPACDVNGLLSGYTEEGAKTVLPAHAMAKVSFRLVGDQDPSRIAELFKEHVERVTPPGVTVTVEELHGGMPWRAKVEGPFFEAATRALERGFGTSPVLAGEGGSIPIVVDFQETLNAPVLLIGFAHPGSALHAPNEWFPAANVEKGIQALIYLYEELEDS